MKNKQIIIILTILFLIIATFVCYYLLVTHNAADLPTRGQIGDTFGVLNALFSALAILGIVYTIFQQNDVIRQSKLDTENSMKEFNESVKQFEQQQKIQALSTLITIYEKKLDQYKLINETNLAVQTNKKLVDLVTELEKYLTK